MNHKCPQCKKVVAKEDRRRKPPVLIAVSPAVMSSHGERLAPKVKCGCGKSVVFLKASL